MVKQKCVCAVVVWGCIFSSLYSCKKGAPLLELVLLKNQNKTNKKIRENLCSSSEALVINTVSWDSQPLFKSMKVIADFLSRDYGSPHYDGLIGKKVCSLLDFDTFKGEDQDLFSLISTICSYDDNVLLSCSQERILDFDFRHYLVQDPPIADDKREIFFLNFMGEIFQVMKYLAMYKQYLYQAKKLDTKLQNVLTCAKNCCLKAINFYANNNRQKPFRKSS